MSAAPRIPRRLRVACLVGELLSPPILVALALVVAWASSPTPGMAVLWGAAAALFASVLPDALILRGVRRGRLSDRNITLREQRVRFGAWPSPRSCSGWPCWRRSRSGWPAAG